VIRKVQRGRVVAVRGAFESKGLRTGFSLHRLEPSAFKLWVNWIHHVYSLTT
jgi:hypothetical protein